jgi:hypothetical protein
LHTGVAPPQSLELWQATHRFDVVSHTGLEPEQSVLLRHCTQVFAVVSHTGAAVLVQSEFTSHTTHDPTFIPEVTHAGPLGLLAQSAFVAHGSQVCVVALHVGVEPAQSELNSQATHVPVGKSHTASPPVHCVPFVAEHWPHPPQTSHAGVAGVEVQSASLAHAVQVPPLHTGVSPPQSAPLRHWTQLLLVNAHRGVDGGQFASAMHETHVPRRALPARSSQ